MPTISCSSMTNPSSVNVSKYEQSDPDFLLSDIQVDIGKARNIREIKMDIDGKEERVLYKIVPC